LPNDNRAARIFERPRHRFVFFRAIWIASVKTEACMMLTINNAAIDWSAIRVNIKDRQKDADTPRFRF
jgi:hypothetical protein